MYNLFATLIYFLIREVQSFSLARKISTATRCVICCESLKENRSESVPWNCLIVPLPSPIKRKPPWLTGSEERRDCLFPPWSSLHYETPLVVAAARDDSPRQRWCWRLRKSWPSGEGKRRNYVQMFRSKYSKRKINSRRMNGRIPVGTQRGSESVPHQSRVEAQPQASIQDSY